MPEADIPARAPRDTLPVTAGRLRLAIAALLEEPANELTLYLRRPQSLPDAPSDRVQIVEGDVPEVLQDATIFSLDMGALLAGTPVGGELWIALGWCTGILIVAAVIATRLYNRRLR